MRFVSFRHVAACLLARADIAYGRRRMGGRGEGGKDRCPMVKSFFCRRWNVGDREIYSKADNKIYIYSKFMKLWLEMLESWRFMPVQSCVCAAKCSEFEILSSFVSEFAGEGTIVFIEVLFFNYFRVAEWPLILQRQQYECPCMQVHNLIESISISR